MTIGHLLCLVLGYAIGAAVGAVSMWRALRQHASTLSVTLDPYVTELMVRKAVTEAMDAWEDAEKDEPDILPGDEWKLRQ